MTRTRDSDAHPVDGEGGDAYQRGGTAATAVITTRQLSKTFSNEGTQQHVLRNLDLCIEAGSFTIVMGPSGAGKSTLLYALSGLDRPSLGTVMFDGQSIESMSQDALARFRRRHCGFIFQQLYLLDSISVMDNVLAAGLLTGSRSSVVERADELFDTVGLTRQDRSKFPGMLSGGEAARVALVRSLINKPSVLFADEPTGQLNSEFSDAVLTLLDRFNNTGQTIVTVTHDIRTASHGSRILYLRDGKVQGELDLSGFAVDDRAGRQTAVATFLSEMGW